MTSGDEGLDTVSSDATPHAVALAYLQALSGSDPALVVALVTADFVNEHHAELGSGCVGRDEYERRLPGFFQMFAGRNYEVIETTVGQSDQPTQATEVVVRYRFSADVDGTGIDIPGVMWISVTGGLVSRRLDCWDSLTFLRQTGAAPVET